MRKGFLLFVLVFAIVTSVAGQPVEIPFIKLLARIPDVPTTREGLSYADYHALNAARPGAPVVTSAAEFNALEDAGTKLYISALNGLTSGPDVFSRYFYEAENMPPVVGFDVFQAARGLTYGNPPQTVTVLEGSFDASAIIAAHEARDYTQTKQDSMTLLCPAAGCETGMQTDMAGINPANPFGGNLGRSQPVLVDQQIVASSPSDRQITLLADGITGTLPSLADNPDYRAAAEAITADGTLIQATFITPDVIPPASTAFTANTRLSAEQIQAAVDELQASFVPMPQYSLAVFADTLTGDEQTTIIALVYASPADANEAAALFPARLQDAVSLQTVRSFGEMLDERGMTASSTEIFSASTDRSVVVVRMTSPLPTATPAEGEQLETISRLYGLLVRAYYAADLGWLATTL